MAIKTNKIDIEKSYLENGIKYIIAIDEVSRGSLWGDVVIGVSVIPFWKYDTPEQAIEIFKGVKDSKKYTSHQQRKELVDNLKQELPVLNTVASSSTMIDFYGIKLSTRIAVITAIDLALFRLQSIDDSESPTSSNTVVITDGGIWKRQKPLSYIYDYVKGDDKSLSIALASVVAKVHRDERILTAIESHPELELHKGNGYWNKDVAQRLESEGNNAHPEYRRSFNPLKTAIGWKPSAKYESSYTYYRQYTSLDIFPLSVTV